jgi:hypothetical protein
MRDASDPRESAGVMGRLRAARPCRPSSCRSCCTRSWGRSASGALPRRADARLRGPRGCGAVPQHGLSGVRSLATHGLHGRALPPPRSALTRRRPGASRVSRSHQHSRTGMRSRRLRWAAPARRGQCQPRLPEEPQQRLGRDRDARLLGKGLGEMGEAGIRRLRQLEQSPASGSAIRSTRERPRCAVDQRAGPFALQSLRGPSQLPRREVQEDRRTGCPVSCDGTLNIRGILC